MGYDIYIGQYNGEAHISKDGRVTLIDLPEDSELGTVSRLALPDAPCFPNDVMTDNENHRHPGYVVWREFTKRAGLEDLFFNKPDGLMCKHPGTVVLTQKHYLVIKTALDNYRQQHPDNKPGFEPSDHLINQVEIDFEPDAILARLIWLEWWVKWAIEHCELPVIDNY